jgi:hypothetical protein
MGLERENFQAVLRTAGEAETQLQLNEEDPEFQLQTEEEIAAVIFFKLIFLGTTYFNQFTFYLASKFFFLLGLYLA